ncbi:hypothetical protein [Amycolatopsis sp. WQ 127309]|uniref:hypothetical protein n=1 Tax=Amycolatopsis sp. WQ 127309 TaxID=2932773 RepID=UPI001FF182BE|nr:hypothetical protein [Amycolatopsis sp. WQ 127309]UOZ05128.1 hypothetical protein MUY22_40890 [Amycolatopsis sp. WQ 127309]
MKTLLTLRPVRHILLTSALALLACALVFAVQLAGYATAAGELRGMTARSTATVVHLDGDSAVIRFALPGGSTATAAVAVDVRPAPGSTLPVFYDPADPGRAAIRGATPLVTTDRTTTYATATVVAAAGVLVVDVLVLLTRFGRVGSGTRRTVPIRRVKVQRGLLTRSWLELETPTPSWLPVYFSPALIGLATPSVAELTGDRRVLVRVGGTTFHPAGGLRTTEPRGRRLDNPAEPDAERAAAARRPVTLRHQLRTDLPVLAVAPVVGVFWALVDGTGVAGWLAVTVLVAAFGFWWAALRGSDPS